MNDNEYYNCTRDDIPIRELTKPCMLFAKELEFQKRYYRSMGKNQTKKNVYLNHDLTSLVRARKAPVEIKIKALDKNRLKLIISDEGNQEFHECLSSFFFVNLRL